MSSYLQKNIRQAEKYLKINEYAKAESIYKEILKKFPQNLKAKNALNNLATINKNISASIYKKEQLQGLLKHYNRQEFALVLEKANGILKLYPEEIDVYNIQGAASAAMGNFKNAINYYQEITKIKPNSATAYFNIAVMYDSLNLPENAIKYYNEAIRNQPKYADAYNNIGSAHIKLDNFDKALEAYNKVIELTPNHAYAHNNLGNIYIRKKMYQKAIKSFKNAIFFDAKYADAFNNLGDAYLEIDNIREGHIAYEKAVAIDPNHVKALIKLGYLHEGNKKHKRAINVYKKILALQPTNETILVKLNFQQSFMCEFDTIKTYKTKIKKAGTKTNHIAPLSMMPFDDAPERQKLRAELYVNRLYPEKSIKLNFKDHKMLKDFEPKVNTNKIRLGYVSADFNSHAVSYLIAGLIESHNRDNFEVFGYSLDSKNSDKMNHRMRKAFDKYIECDDLSNEEVALRIKREDIDILVDLNGHTLGSRTGIFAYRPSKIQINFLGFPGTMGASYIDYIISDYTVIPDKFKEFYNEKIIRLPHTYMPTDNKRIIADKLITRKEMGLPQKGIIFCCFNNSYKISHIEFDIWMRILSKIKDSILWLKIDNNDTARENLRNAALKRGVDPSRIIFAEYLSMEEHLARYALADIFLDTFNYNAHTTACDSLWAGTPIVTKSGKSFVSRVAGSLLTAIDIPELITNSELEYENLILKLASSPDNLKKIKQKLHENISIKPLFDTKKYTHYLETAFIKAFTNHSSGNKPIDIDISE